MELIQEIKLLLRLSLPENYINRTATIDNRLYLNKILQAENKFDSPTRDFEFGEPKNA